MLKEYKKTLKLFFVSSHLSVLGTFTLLLENVPPSHSITWQLGSDIGNTTPGGENRKFSQVSFYIIRIDK